MALDEPGSAALAFYVVEASGVDPGNILFIRLDGSAAEGLDERYSDYDLVVVCKSDKAPDKKDFWGILNDRLVSFWVISLEEYRELFCEVNDNEFIWQKHSSKVAKTIFGDRKTFEDLGVNLQKTDWNIKIQDRAVEFSYGNVIEYLGKLLNTISGKDENYTFFFYAAQMAHHYVQFIAALNQLDIRSLNTLHDQVFHAKNVPGYFQKDFLTLSGYSETSRSMVSTLSSARNLVKWAREFLITEYGLDRFDSREFREMVLNLSYQYSEVL